MSGSLSVPDDLDEIFAFYAAFGEEGPKSFINKSNLYKFVRDCRLLSAFSSKAVDDVVESVPLNHFTGVWSFKSILLSNLDID